MKKYKFYMENYYDRKYNWQFHLIPFISIEIWNPGAKYKNIDNSFFITVGWLFWGIIFSAGSNIE